MHKKPLVAVLIFGLLLLVHSVGFAKTDSPYKLQDDGQVLPFIARGLAKEAPTSPTALSGPTTNIQAGVSRTGATFCDGEWQGGGAYFYGGWLYGDEFYAAYQDPENLGTCIGNPSVYTFDVTAVNWFVFMEDPNAYDYDLQPLVYDNGGDALCPVPGSVICAGPVYTISFPAGGGAYILNLPFVDPCCSYADYFAGVYVATYSGPGILTIIIDDGLQTETCYTYNDWGPGWYDFGAGEGYNLELWSEGTTYDQNSCPGTPGVCDWVAFHNGIAVYSTDPNVNGQTDRYVRFNPDVECTLVAAAFPIYDGGGAGTPTCRVRVYGNNGPTYAGRMYPGAFGVPPGADPNIVFEFDIPYGAQTFYPAFHVVDFSVEDPNWPTGYIYGTGENLFVSTSLSPLTPDPVNDIIAFMLDGGPGAGRSGSWIGIFGDYYYNDEVFATVREQTLEAYFCCQFVELTEVACSNPGPDNWPTWGHDYNRTCATSINVGDPCEVTAAWSTPLEGALNSFCGPTIADGLVYASVDDKLYSLNLTSGVVGNSVSGLPYIFSNNRGNMTIDGGNVYITGGNGQSISQWSADLTLNNWVNGLPAVGNGPLGGSCRFGVTAVYDIAGTEVVVVGTEGATGRLWCFETATGAAYPGWATNPVVLADGIWHGLSYDGTDLYVGTANTSNVEGDVYRIDAATGAIVWTFTPTNPLEGFPGGVSLDGGNVYVASSAATQAGTRIKLDKATGGIVWEFGQARALYGTPAIGRNFVYINQDVAGAGVLVVDKGTGAALYNFAANGVGPVTQHATITCDNFLFAGDRNGLWWLLNVDDQAVEFNVQFNGIVNNTAIANDGVDDFAVVSIRSGNDVDGGGYAAAFKFSAGVRPRVAQSVPGVEIPVPFGTLGGNAYNEPDLLSNLGCADLIISSHNIYDPAPDVTSRLINDEQSRYAAAMANTIVGADYTAYFDNSSKAAQLANLPLSLVNSELTRGDVAIENAHKALVDSKRSGSRMAAGAAIVRTSGVAYTTPLPAGSSTDVDFLYDGTGLARGIDVEEIEFITNDPDRIFFNNQPLYTITYIGGCLNDETTIVWNTLGAANEHLVTNSGRVGDDDNAAGLDWGADPNSTTGNLYEGSFFLAGPVAPNVDTAQWYIGDMYEGWTQYNGLFRGNPITGTDNCGFTSDTDVLMGYKRTGGCPGTAEPILGAWTRSYFVDSNSTYGGTVYEAIGLDIVLTEVGAYDPLFGDFSIIKWDLTERYGESEGPIYAGTYMDWDAGPDYEANFGLVSDNFNGYVMWDWDNPALGYGMLDPRMSTDYCGLNTTEYSPHRIQEMGRRCPGDVPGPSCGAWGFWQDYGPGDLGSMWTDVVTGAARENGPYAFGGYPNLEDHAGVLVNKAVNLGPNETKSVVQALFAVDASTGTGGASATIEALSVDLGKRAAIWGGWARGDANMDGCVNLIDVCWLGSGNQIYPDTYNGDVDIDGDVDGDDSSYLLNYVTGLGAAPLGEWRFTF